MLNVEITFNKRQMRDVERLLRGIPKGMPKVINRAIRRTVTSVRVQMVKAIRDDVNVKQKDIFQKGNKRRPVTETLIRKGGGVVGGHIEVTGRRIPLSKFGATQTKKGVAYRIDKSGGRKKIEGAFKATMSSSHEGVFRRKGRSIVQLFGPSIPHVALNQAEVVRLIKYRAGEMLKKNVDSQVEYLLSKGKPGA